MASLNNATPLDQVKYKIKEIEKLYPGLDNTLMPEGSAKDQIYLILKDSKHTDMSEEWVWKFDIIMGVNTCDDDGHWYLGCHTQVQQVL
jgi:hypothetical protein